MGKSGGFIGNSPQAQALRRVEARVLQLAIIKTEALALLVFEVKLAVVRAMQGVCDRGIGQIPVHFRLFEKQALSNAVVAHTWSPR